MDQPSTAFTLDEYQFLFNELNQGIAIADASSGLLLECNPAMAKLVGRSRDELIGQHQSILHPPEDILDNGQSRTYAHHSNGQSGQVLAARVITRSGEIIHVDIKATPMQLHGRQVLVGFFSECNEQVRYQKLLQRRERALGILALATRKINESLEIEDILRSLVRSAIDLVDGQSGAAGYLQTGEMVFREYLSGQEVMPIDYRFGEGHGVPGLVMQTRAPYVTNDAENDPHVIPEIQQAIQFHTLINVPIISRAERLIGCFEIHNKTNNETFDNQDVEMLTILAAAAADALEKAEAVDREERVTKALVESEARLHDLIHTTSDWIWEIDRDGYFTFSSRQSASMLGYEADELLGKCCFDFMRPEESERVRLEFMEYADRCEAYQGFINEMVHKNGSRVVMESSGVPFFDEQDDLLGYRGVDRNITQKLLEEQQRESQQTMVLSVQAVVDSLKEQLLWQTTDTVLADLALRMLCAEQMPLPIRSGVIYLREEAQPPRLVRTAERALEGETISSCDAMAIDACPVSRWGAPSGASGAEELPVRAIGCPNQSDQNHYCVAMRAERGGLIGIMTIYLQSSATLEEYHLEGIHRIARTLANLVESGRSERQVRQLSVAVDQSPTSVVITDTDGVIRYANPRTFALTGYEPEEVLGSKPALFSSGRTSGLVYQDLWETIKSGQSWHGEIQNRKKNGDLYWEEMIISPVKDEHGEVINYLAVKTDITDRKRHQEQLEYLATHDALTGLPNRTLINDRIEQSIERGRRYQHEFALLLLDLDQFKNVNDNYGHQVGDKLLRTVSYRLGRLVRKIDTIGRLGGDEFILILNELASRDDATRVSDAIRSSFSEPIEIDGQPFDISASIGISLYPEHGETIEALMSRSDMALYYAKESGRNTYKFFEEKLDQGARERLDLYRELKLAMIQDQLVLYYQPKIDLRSGRMTGCEALVRWVHPERGMIAPGRFIGIAEETGLIHELGRWVLRHACQQSVNWQKAGFDPIEISVNISALQLQQPNFADSVGEIMAQTGADPRHIDLELTESVIMDDPDSAISVFRQLKSFGCSISGDDFGTGYSSLNYLKRLPLDRIKIDRSFVRDIETDAEDAVIARTIINMGHNLGLKVLAEGVETEGQLDYLKNAECDEIQGYLFSRPVPADEFVACFERAEWSAPAAGDEPPPAG